MSTTVNIYTHPACLGHIGFPRFAEKPGRLETLNDLFNTLSLPVHETGISDETIETVLRLHDPRYVAAVEAISKQSPLRATLSNFTNPYIQWYTRVSPGSYNAALHAVEAVRSAVDDVVAGRVKRAFCAIRPPGHHAGPGRGEGFCLFNNIAAGALTAMDKGMARVAIVDFDQHHGNGTQAMIEQHEMNNVMLISSYQEGCKYNTPEQRGRISKNVLTVPLPRGGDFRQVRARYEDEVVPALFEFKPQLILISAGFDLHKDDPLSKIKLKSSDYDHLTAMLVDAADELCEGRIVSALEGGYDQPALKECVSHHLAALRR